MNTTLDFAGLRVYGLLTDLTQFKFYSYDPSTRQFGFDETILVDNKRVSASFDSVNGMCNPSLQLLRAEFFFLPLQLSIRSSVLFYRPIWRVYVQL
jgi:hypothetical protein